ncbi:MAG: hypothetical protein AABZ08_01720 [Planctomycetota bacterium]
MLTPETNIRAADDNRALILTAIGLVASLIAASLDPLGVLHADDLTHYLFAKEAWRWPTYLLHDWGRPGFTIPYALPAAFSWLACRALSAILSALSAWFAYRIAGGLGLRAAWAVIPLCYLQPLFFKLSQTTLTETPLAFYLTLALYLAQRRKWTLSSTIISLAFITRHEAIIFLPIWLYFARKDRVPLLRLAPILWAPILVNTLAPIFGVGTILTRMIDPASTGQYGHGGWLTYFARSLEASGPGIMVLAMIGIFYQLKPFTRAAMPAACALTYFATQTIIRALGLYDSGGYARFLVPIAPLIAIAALSGWHQLRNPDATTHRRATLLALVSMSLLWLAMERQLILYAMRMDEIAELPEIHYAKLAMRIATAGIAIIALATLARRTKTPSRLLPASLAILTALATWSLSGRLYAPPETQLIRAMNEWRTTHGHSLAPIISASVWIDYLTDRDLPPDRPSVRTQLELAPLGTCFAWEKQFAPTPDHKVPLTDLQHSNCFELIYQSAPIHGEKEPFIRLYKKIAPWPPPTPPV